MKLLWFTALLALGLTEVTASCESKCQSNLVHYKEQACEYWRSRLPRPDLYNNCGEGYTLGKKAGCAGYCSSKPNASRLSAQRLDACSAFQRVPPIDRQEACRSGFSAALERARQVAVVDEFEENPTAFGTPDGTGAMAKEKKSKIGIKTAPTAELPVEKPKVSRASEAEIDLVDSDNGCGMETERAGDGAGGGCRRIQGCQGVRAVSLLRRSIAQLRLAVAMHMPTCNLIHSALPFIEMSSLHSTAHIHTVHLTCICLSSSWVSVRRLFLLRPHPLHCC